MHVRLPAFRLVDLRHRRGREDLDGDVLRDGRFAVRWRGEISWVVVAFGRFGGVVVATVGADRGGASCWEFGRAVVVVVVVGSSDSGRARREGVRGYCQGEKGHVIDFREAEGGGRGVDGGAEGAVEVGEGDAEVDCVDRGGGLDGIGLEDGVLIVRKGWRIFLRN